MFCVPSPMAAESHGNRNQSHHRERRDAQPLREFSHHLYQIPEVNIHIDDGRSFIRSSRDRYDVLQMTLVDTWASTAAGAFALSENNLYTVEAFKEYIEHLKPDGMLAITRWEFREPREAVRVVSVAMDACISSA
jgi:spermidine synthase